RVAESGARRRLYQALNRLTDDVFFFSSRRRHTRSDRDWSSDVCSSDLSVDATPSRQREYQRNERSQDHKRHGLARERGTVGGNEIGRASCRERVENTVGGGSKKKKKESKRQYNMDISVAMCNQ